MSHNGMWCICTPEHLHVLSTSEQSDDVTLTLLKHLEDTDSWDETNKINGVKPTEYKRFKVEDPKHIRGDYSQLQVTRHERTMHFKDRRSKIFVAADEMSGKIIEEREMLSLGTRSRGTSRNTSRAASPTQTKKMLQNSEDKKLIMPPVTESRAASNISNRRSEDTSANKESDLLLVTDATKDSDNISRQKPKKKGKKHTGKSKSKVAAEPSEHMEPNDESELILNDVKAIPDADGKTKPKKTHGKQKSKHRKHKKHRKSKSGMVEEISDTEMKGDDEDSGDEQIENVANVNKPDTVILADILKNANQTGSDTQLEADSGILNDITNSDSKVHKNIPGTVAHVHFSDEVRPRSRSSSTSELDSKRG